MADQPLNDINDCTPTSFSHLVGQRSVVAQVSVALESAFADGRAFDHSLLVGPPGTGKSQVAKLVAAEMAGTLHERFQNQWHRRDAGATGPGF